MRDLSGRVAVVTGASSGIGRALAVRLAREGMTLMLADVDRGGLAETAALARETKVLTQITDVSDAVAVRHLADRAFGELGAVHLLCNNAGVFQGGYMWTRTCEDFAWMLGVNLWGILHGINCFVPRMIEQNTEGHILNTVSGPALFAGPRSGAYSLSKYAAFAASQALAQDLAAAGSQLGVTALCPGWSRTQINRSERVRPADLAMPRTRDDLATQHLLDGLLAAGINPDQVVEAAIKAVRNDRFLALTHPGHEQGLRDHVEQLLAGMLPTVPELD